MRCRPVFIAFSGVKDRTVVALACSLRHEASAIGIVLATSFLLSLPPLAMQSPTKWPGPGDFALAGALIVGTGLLLRAGARKAGELAYRAAAGVALAAMFLLVWTNLAVGIIGEPDELTNVMYVGVVAVGTVGAITARFQPEGMSRALLATALVQALVGSHSSPESIGPRQLRLRDPRAERVLRRPLDRIGLGFFDTLRSSIPASTHSHSSSRRRDRLSAKPRRLTGVLS